MSKITDLVSNLAGPICRDQGCELWDVEYVREAGTWYLRVYIDKEGGVSINDCTAVSQALDPILDEQDPIPDSYVFEVCSAGLERQLRRPSDYERFQGAPVTLKLYSAKGGSKERQGYLLPWEEDSVSVSYKDGTTEKFLRSEVASVWLRIE
ncbi:MAG: ribosome maturation factor RimP [Oscillospiraceae bacterium]|nr:ribosome maturation factor RimP [Oscillospiraceae bacterium]